MAHLCVPQNQALGVCRGFAPDIQICGTHGRKNLVNATIISNAEEEEDASDLTLNVQNHTIPHELCRCQVKDVNGLQSFVLTHSEEKDSFLLILCLQ